MFIGHFGYARMYRRLLGRIHVIIWPACLSTEPHLEQNSAIVKAWVLVHNAAFV
jgi:hypothetical protein